MELRTRRLDRRIERTRHLIQHAFIALASEKAFEAISVRDITERANVNRGTFYAHYADKYVLLETIMREQFQTLLASTLPPVAAWDRDALHLLIQTVLEYFKRTQRDCRLSREVDALIERAAYPELKRLLVAWLQHTERSPGVEHVPVDTIAQMMSAAVFGAAAQWCQASTVSSSAMAHDVLLVMLEGVARLTPADRSL